MSDTKRFSYAYISLLGAFLVQLTFGSYYSFANIMPYLVSYMRQHSDEAKANLTYGDFIMVWTAWGMVQGMVLPVGGSLVATIGVRKTLIAGSVLFACAPLITSYTIKTSLWSVVFSMGILSSIGQNLAILPTLTVPMKWFPNRKGLVSGISVSGFGLGAFVFNAVQTKIVNPLDLHVSQGSANGTHPDVGYFVQQEVLSEVPKMLQVMGIIYFAILMVGAFLLLAKKPLETVTLKKENRKFIPLLKQLLTRKEFYFLWTIRFGMILICQNLMGFYKAFALEELGYRDEFVSIVGGVAGIFNCLGRLLFGFLMDKFPYKCVMGTQSVVVLVLVATFYWTSNISENAFAAVLWICYLCLAGFFAIHPAICSRIFGPGLDVVAIGFVSSSDIVNNVIIGLFAKDILRQLGWKGFFLATSSFSILAFGMTMIFPARSLTLTQNAEVNSESKS